MADDGFHDFQAYTWKKPLIRPQRGIWPGNMGGGTLTGTPILDENGAPILDETGQAIYSEGAGSVGPSLIPALLMAPIVTGIPTQGQTLITTIGQWSQSPGFYLYQWLRNGVAISGATSSGYSIGAADVGAQITAQITAVNAVGYSSPGFSRSVGPIAATFVASATPVTTGTHGVPYAGFTVAVSGGWSPYAFNLIQGFWPNGIFMNGGTGVVSGTPTSAGTSSGITIQVTDRYGLISTLSPFSIVIS